jgi:hypothetical protein
MLSLPRVADCTLMWEAGSETHTGGIRRSWRLCSNHLMGKAFAKYFSRKSGDVLWKPIRSQALGRFGEPICALKPRDGILSLKMSRGDDHENGASFV